GNILGCGAGVFGQLANFVGNYSETTARFSGASGFDGGVQSKQVGLLGNVVNDVDDLANFQRTVAERFDLLGGRLHRGADSLHTFQRISHGAVALFGCVECATRSFGAGFRVVRHLLHGDSELFHGGRSVGDFLVLLRGAVGHLFRRNENVVGTRRDIDGGLANSLEHLCEVIEHVIDRVDHVAERVVGDLAAKRQVPTGDLADDRQEVGHAALQIFLCFLVEDGTGGAFGGAVQVLGDVAEIIRRV